MEIVSLVPGNGEEVMNVWRKNDYDFLFFLIGFERLLLFGPSLLVSFKGKGKRLSREHLHMIKIPHTGDKASLDRCG